MKTVEQEVIDLLISWEVDQPEVIAKEIFLILDPNNLRAETNRTRCLRAYVLGFSDGRKSQGK